MKKILTTFLTVLLLTGLTTAAQENIQPDPGIISADHPLYPADIAADQALQAIGIKDQGDIAYERASEIQQAVENGDNESAEQARQQLNNVAEAATNQSTQGLEKAEQVLQQVKEQAPEQAQTGLDQALENIGKAKNRPSGVQRPDTTPETPR